jgi:hypothetical protein
MDASITALLIAVVGVFGTLFAPIVSQRLSARARREEFELQRLHRQEEYDRERQQEIFVNKRNCYIEIISAARRYRLELMNHLYEVNRGTVDYAASARLEEARLAFGTSFAQAQLTGTLAVLEAVEPIRKGMSDSYQSIKNLEEGAPNPGESFEEVRDFLLGLWDEWPRLHTAIRVDLGVKD